MNALAPDTRYAPAPRRVQVPLVPMPWGAVLAAVCDGSPRDARESARAAIARRLGASTADVRLTTSGTTALRAALGALGAKGAEVILSTFNCPNVAEAVVAAGLRPVFCDVGPGSYNASAATVSPLISRRTVAVLATHVFGEHADVCALASLCRHHGIALIDDAAQAFGGVAHGKPLGRWGAFGVLSFGRHKPIFAGGGGALVVNDRSLLARVPEEAVAPSRPALTALARAAVRDVLRRAQSDLPSRLGLDAPPLTDVVEALARVAPDSSWRGMPSVTAALVASQVVHLDHIRRRAHAHAERYSRAMHDHPHLLPPTAAVLGGELAFFPARARSCSRHSIAAELARSGVETTWQYFPLHALERYRSFARGPLPRAEVAWRDTICLPCRASQGAGQVERVVRAIERLRQWRVS